MTPRYPLNPTAARGGNTGMRNTEALFRRLHAAALRAIAANGISPVGRDGRARFEMESVIAQGDLANLLREIGGEIPVHAPKCAARLSPIRECDCFVRSEVAKILEDS